MVLFGADRGAEADAALTENLATWRKVYGPRDLRLADKLEQNAELVQKGFRANRRG